MKSWIFPKLQRFSRKSRTTLHYPVSVHSIYAPNDHVMPPQYLLFIFHVPGSNFVWSHKTGRGTLDATECLIKTFFFKYSYWAHLPFFPMAIEWCVWGRDWRLKQWSWVKLSVGSKQSSCLTKVGKWISDFPSHHTSIMINHVQFQIFCRSVQPTDHIWNDHKLMMKIMKINRNEIWVFTEEKLHLLAS